MGVDGRRAWWARAVIKRNVIGSASPVIAERAEAALRTDETVLLHYALEWMREPNQ